MLQADFQIDPKRMYACGISNGGMMSLRIACELPDLFSAIAVVAANMSTVLNENCQPAVPISVLFICGTEDPLVPWNGGKVGFSFLRSRGKVLSVNESVEFWREKNHCSHSGAENIFKDIISEDESTVTEYTFPNGDNGAEVILLKVNGGGHTWPGGWAYLPEYLIGVTNRDFSASEYIWQFFNRHHQ
jgi:polyhydroxybutyrate depolymerase